MFAIEGCNAFGQVVRTAVCTTKLFHRKWVSIVETFQIEIRYWIHHEAHFTDYEIVASFNLHEILDEKKNLPFFLRKFLRDFYAQRLSKNLRSFLYKFLSIIFIEIN